MKKLLLLLVLCCGVMTLSAAKKKPVEVPVSLDKNGCLKAGGLRFSGDTYYKKVNYVQYGKSWKSDGATNDKISGISTNNGKIFVPEQPEIKYSVALAKATTESYIYTFNVSGIARNFTVRTSFTPDVFAGRELDIDGKKVQLPLENLDKKMLVSSGKAKKLGIPCSDCYVEIEFEKPNNYTIHDYRPGTKSFSLMLAVPRPDKKATSSTLRFKVSTKAYTATPLDLSKAVNMSFTDKVDSDGKGGWTDQGPENDLRMVPLGKQRFKGTDFCIIDPKKNNNKSCIALRGAGRPYFPESATAEIGGKASGNYLNILHARAWNSSNNN